MKETYCSMRLNKHVEESDPWPPIKTKSYVTLALAYQKELQTTQETTATIYLRTKGDIDKIPQTIDATKLTDIVQIFDSVSGRGPKVILIEGHAGIGKTTLVKQVCIEWAEGKLLTSDKLVLLLLLRDPNVQEITNVHKLIEHFTNSTSKVEQLCSCLEDKHGDGVTLIIDGFDELSTELRDFSFFRQLIEKRFLLKAKVLVTSRPSASACLHRVVDKRIEILGFEQSSKNQYVTEALQDFPSKLEKLQRHFQQYPNINAICYIPLIMSIIVFLCMCQPDELPPTATKMYASFILHTIYHHLKRVGKLPKDTIVNKLEQFPQRIRIALRQLERTAFDGLTEDKIVFTVEELPLVCIDDPTCYGLLQSTECFSAEECGTPTKSFNFLHLGIQEYFAAKHVTTLPENRVKALLEESFFKHNSLSVRLSNMWILYCGITSGQCKTLRHYLATYGDQRRSTTEIISQQILVDQSNVLYLFQCFQEAQDVALCKILSKSFDNGVIDISKHSLLPYQVVSLGYFLSKSDHKKLEKLNLSGCHIGDHGMSILHQYLCGHRTSKQEILEVNLSENNLTGASSPLIVDIINHLQVHTLWLYNNNSDLETQVLITKTKTLRVLHISNIRVSGIAAIANALIDNCSISLEELNLNGNEKLAMRIRYNNTITKFELPNVYQSYDGVIDISEYSLSPYQVGSLGFFLSKSHHRKWKQLNLSKCHIGDHSISILHQYLCQDKAKKLEIIEINLSENNLTGASSPLIVDIINHLQVHTLWLHNNNGDLETQVLITKTKTLRVLHISNIRVSGIAAIANALIDNCSISLEELNLNGNEKLAMRIRYNNTITKFELPNVYQSYDGVIDISEYSLSPYQVGSLGFFLSKSHHRKWKQLNLSKCHIGDHSISIFHQYLCQDKAKKLEITEINLSENNLTGASSPLIVDIVNHLQVHTLWLYNNIDLVTDILKTKTKTLRVLHINNISVSGIADIVNVLVDNCSISLEELNLNDDDKFAMRIIYNNTITKFELPNIHQSYDGVINISGHSLFPHQAASLGFFLSKSHHTKWKQLNLSKCHIGDYGMSLLHQYLCGDKASKHEILEINLSENDLTGASSPLIADIISHLQIHTLLLCNNNITNVRDISTSVINFSTVKVLNLDGNGITAQEAGAISDMMVWLEELYISSKLHNRQLKSNYNANKLSDHGAELLTEGITKTKTLRVLHIADNNIGPSGITAIANALVNNISLEELNLNNNEVGKNGAISIPEAITNNKTLKILLLNKFYAMESAMTTLMSLQNSNTITRVEFADISLSFDHGVIDISGHDLFPPQVESLGFFLSKSQHRKWKEFNLLRCHIGDDGMGILHQYLCGNRTNKLEITEINLSENNLTGASSPLIADIISHLRVHVLWLHNNDITTNVRDIATAVIVSSTVKVLSLNDNYITTLQATAISDMTNCLEELYLSRFNRKLNTTTISKGISDLGAELLSIGIRNTKTLRVLHIADNNIGSSGAIAIANALVSNTSLEELNLNYNKIGEDGYKAIAKAIINNKTLKILLLYSDSKMDESAMIILRSLHHNNTIINLVLPYI